MAIKEKEGYVLDKVIHDIVSVDLECSKRVEEARKKKLDVQSNMNAKKKEIYDSFIDEYQVKIDARKKELETQIRQTKAKNEEEYKESLSQLSSLYETKKDEWVSTIVSHCKEI